VQLPDGQKASISQLALAQIMHDSRLDEIARKFVVATGAAPAAVVAVAWRGALGFQTAVGAASTPGKFVAAPDSLFDLASVSKPFLASTVARLARRERLELATPLGELLAEARGTATGAQSLELLLAHRAGLEAHRTLFAPLLREAPFERHAAISEALHARRAECSEAASSDGYPPLYSDLGYALVGLALERLEGLPLDQIVDREVCEPLGLSVGSARLLSARHADFTVRCAATERVPFRGHVHGIVHDENAWALSGHALSGHAGLFGTAESVARFGVALLDAASGRSEAWLSRKSLEPLVRARPGGTLRAGFDGKSETGSSAGSLAGARSFGHLGFTGTSLWCDPDADRVLVLLANRVCPTRENTRIRAARPAVHDALFAAV
jgi:CubicO group peptidase (beta-lactamase class C family)